ncbi:MAG: hypothetical protein ACFE96_04740 [Candidatus Hermodarchaeota archaeon]
MVFPLLKLLTTLSGKNIQGLIASFPGNVTQPLLKLLAIEPNYTYKFISLRIYINSAKRNENGRVV